MQRKLVYASGRFWVFYVSSDGKDMGFKSKVPFGSWSTYTSISPPGAGSFLFAHGIDLEVQDNTLYIVIMNFLAATSYDRLFFRKGTLNADGSVTWDADWVTIETLDADKGGVSIAVDAANNYIYVSGYWNLAPDYYVRVWRSSDLSGSSWTLKLTAAALSTTGDITKLLVDSLGDAYFLHGAWTQGVLRIRLSPDYGDTWSDPYDTPAAENIYCGASCALLVELDVEEKIHLVYYEVDDIKIRYMNFDIDAWEWSSPEDLKQYTSGLLFATAFRRKEEIHAIYCSRDANHLARRRRISGQWSEEDQPFGTSFTSPWYPSTYPQALAQNDYKMGILWLEETTTPYNLESAWYQDP